MIIRFAVENFRSIRERQELSWVASALKDLEQMTTDVPSVGVSLLHVLAIYGANASGKTSVLRALSFMTHAVVNSQGSWRPTGPIPIQPFLLDEESNGRTSYFDIDLIIDGVRINYGFELDSSQVHREWLYAYPRGKKQIWFERQSGSEKEFHFGKHLQGENRSIQSLTRANSLFLSAAAQNGHQQLLPLFQWFATKLDVVNFSRRGGVSMKAAELCKEPSGRAALLKLLAAADLGIVDVDITERKLDEKTEGALRAFINSLSEKEAEFDAKLPEIRLKHQAADGKSVALRFDDESEGTKALLSLAFPVLHAIKEGGLLCVDELDASLHPLLALEIIKAFLDPALNVRGAQLIFNTHDVNLLDSEILRRDQIWFTEKDGEGSTHIYPLSDFRTRRHENLKRGYLQGRYGAVPVPSPMLGFYGK